MIKFSVDGATITYVTSKSGILVSPITSALKTDQRRLAFTGTPLPGSVDEGQFQARLFDSNNVKIGEMLDGGPAGATSATVLLSTVNDAMEVCRVIDNGSQGGPIGTGDGNNDANPPNCWFGGIGWYFNVGTVNGTPNVLLPEWYNMRLEITVSGHINRSFFTRVNDNIAQTTARNDQVVGAGRVLITIPITVTETGA